MDPSDPAHHDFWQAVGVSDDARALYLDAFAEPGTSVRSSRWRTDRLRSARDELVRERLARLDGARLTPLDPRLALVSLARRRQGLLDRATTLAETLSASLTRATLQADPYGFIRILQEPQEIFGQLLDLLQHARAEVVGTVAPPFVAAGDPAVRDAELDLLRRGVPFRSIYDDTVLERPDRVADLTGLVAAGEQARVLPRMRTKLLIVDGASAFVPLQTGPDGTEPAAALITASALTDALHDLFEQLWRQGRPFGSDSERVPEGLRGIDAVDRQLLQLLANGVGDHTAASLLGMSERTFRRRIAALHQRLRTTNRLQLGVAVADLVATTRADRHPRARHRPR